MRDGGGTVEPDGGLDGRVEPAGHPRAATPVDPRRQLRINAWLFLGTQVLAAVPAVVLYLWPQAAPSSAVMRGRLVGLAWIGIVLLPFTCWAVAKLFLSWRLERRGWDEAEAPAPVGMRCTELRRELLPGARELVPDEAGLPVRRLFADRQGRPLRTLPGRAARPSVEVQVWITPASVRTNQHSRVHVRARSLDIWRPGLGRQAVERVLALLPR